MVRKRNPTWIVGDHWLDKRRDGRAPDIWQIASYSDKSRSVVYRSTRTDSLDEAKGIIEAYVAQLRAKRQQAPEDAEIAPQLMLYWKERGPNLVNKENAAQAIRMFFAFLGQDEAGYGVTFAQANPALFGRFATWRKGAHSWSVQWGDKRYEGSSKGVALATVQRNLNDLRAGLNHAVENGRVTQAPKVPNVEKRPAGNDERPLTMQQLGSIFAYAADNKPLWQWLCLMLGTGARPNACLAFDPAKQAIDDTLDMHPPAWEKTKKHNAVVPLINPLKTVIKYWEHSPAASRKTAWRNMRSILGLPAHVVPKSIRHTVATELLKRGIPHEELSRLLGHTVLHRTTAIYARYTPEYLARTKEALTTLYHDVMRAAQIWSADHLRTTSKNGRIGFVKRSAEN